MYVFSDEDDLNFTDPDYNPKTFKIIDYAEDNKFRSAVYRINDMAESAEFGRDSADEEFAIIVPRK